MKFLGACLTLAALLLVASAVDAQADNTSCAGAIFLVPDGNPREGAFEAQFEGRWFRFVAKANRSYSITGENLTSTDVQRNVTVSTPIEGACGGPVLAGSFVGNTMEPVPVANDNQPNQTGGTRILLRSASNVDVFFPMFGGPGSFRIRVDDTTMFSPSWSTKGGRQTYYSFQNTTTSPTEGTLKLFNGAGAEVASITFAYIPAGGTAFTNTAAMGVAAEQRGSAVFLYIGTAGAISAHARIDDMPVKFEPARDQR